ncbi:TRAP transporter large permease subunit [Amylibacter sp.]|nr:TRAP transporter large permease subunit [Amylibacter sp.]
MELFFLLLLIALMAGALGSGYPVAFALPGASIITLVLAGLTGYLITGDQGAYFSQGDAWTWLSSGNANLRGTYWVPERDTLIAIPLFIFMGIMLQRSKIAEDLLLTMANLFGPVRGGLGVSVVFVGALLAATTGIVGATVVAMGLISLPAMLRNNYSQSLATGTIAASGTLGQIIPPSIVLIILADQLASAADQGSSIRKALHKETTGELSMPSTFDVTSTSAGEMFLGAFIPGLVLVCLYIIYILVFAFLKPSAAPSVPYKGKYDRAFASKVFLSLVPPLFLIFIVLGSIMSGIATVNQAGAIGAAGALIMAGYRLTDGQKGCYHPAILCLVSLLAVGLILSNFDTNIKGIETGRDQLGVFLAVIATIGLLGSLVWSGYRAFKIEDTLNGVMMETAKATALVFIILLGAAILTAAFRAFGGEHLVKEFLDGLAGGFWSKFIIVMAVIFILGFFLDFIEIAVVVVPIVAPILLADPGANVTAVWLGVMIGLNIQTSFLTPPFGFALFYLRGIAPAVVKTINMYKGVIPFIVLQIIAMVIVANSPNLVNYLPNRVALLSENSPPPRNPQIAYCVDQYVSNQISINGDIIIAGAETASKIDLSVLPKKLLKNTSNSFANVNLAIDQLRSAELITEESAQAAINFRPLHQSVRSIERNIRSYEEEIKHIKSDMKNLGEGGELRPLEEKITRLEKEKEVLIAIPENWNEELKTFRNLQKAEQSAYRKYTKSAQAAYQPIANMNVILEANSDYFILEEELLATKAQVENLTPEEMIEPLGSLGKRFSKIAGSEKIKSAISKARRALKSRNPSKEKAQKQLNKAIKLYSEQVEWRTAAAVSILPKLITYEDLMRETIGIRDQAKLTKQQALFVAKCQANHRDVSLNF